MWLASGVVVFVVAAAAVALAVSVSPTVPPKAADLPNVVSARTVVVSSVPASPTVSVITTALRALVSTRPTGRGGSPGTGSPPRTAPTENDRTPPAVETPHNASEKEVVEPPVREESTPRKDVGTGERK